MKISVIIPTYKPADYLWQCLDSLCTQTLDKSLYEVIIVLNGCKEPYQTKIEHYIQNHSDVNFRLIQTDTGGVSNARNIGIEAAKGEYLSFVDDDDWVTSDYLESMLILATPETVVVTNVLLINDEDGSQMDYFLTDAYARNAVLDKMTFFSARSFLSSACCKLIPRAVIADARFDTSYKLGEDALFMFLISCRIKELRMTGHDTVYSVRCRQSSASRSSHVYWYRLCLGLRLTCSYTRIYLTNIRCYDFLLYVSRIVATLRKLFYRRYE